MTSPIKHIFVLMLENRSFDHMLAYSGIAGLQGVDTSKSNPNPAPPGGTVAMSSAALNVVATDPWHEFEHVDWQMYRAARPNPLVPRPITLNGFVDKSGSEAMLCAAPNLLPVLTTLAREFVVCDHWFSSMPGPTWPNRYFVHAGSSGGLANSPSNLTTIGSLLWSKLGFSFQNGTVFDRIERGTMDGQPLTWRVYHGDYFPQVCSIDTMPSTFVADPKKFRAFKKFAGDAAAGDVASYTFIEPDYGILSKFRNGNSQHPTGSLSAGEQLIRDVYNVVSQPPLWNNSLLIIAYDEHGGFYDQMSPPRGEIPGDDNRNAGKAKNPPNPPFGFDQLGIRVPAVVVSPWVQAGQVAHETYDHASIVRTVFDLFQLPGQLTNRDGKARSLRGLLQPAPRGGPAPTLPPVAAAAEPPAANMTAGPVDNNASLPAVDGYTRIAAQIHLALQHFQAPMIAPQLHNILRDVQADPTVAAFPRTEAVEDSMSYLERVASLIDGHRIAQGEGTIK